MDQGFEGMNYFQSMRLHKEAFGAIVQANVESFTENFKNIGAVESSKLIELRKSTTGTESQITIKYLKEVSTMLLSCT